MRSGLHFRKFALRVCISFAKNVEWIFLQGTIKDIDARCDKSFQLCYNFYCFVCTTSQNQVNDSRIAKFLSKIISQSKYGYIKLLDKCPFTTRVKSFQNVTCAAFLPLKSRPFSCLFFTKFASKIMSKVSSGQKILRPSFE